MSYKIAVVSSDGVNIDQSFGAANEFRIYEAADDGKYHLLEIRQWKEPAAGVSSDDCTPGADRGCGSKAGIGCGSGGGCGGTGQTIPKLELVSDCRSILCSKIGFQVRKQMEKKAIAAFDIEYPINEALHKIVSYFSKIDHHQSLKDFSRRQKQD